MHYVKYVNMTYKESTEYYCDRIKEGTKVYARLVFPDLNITLDEEDFSSNGLTLTTILNPDDEHRFGNAIATEMVAYILKNSKTENIDWKTTAKLEMGVEVTINGSTFIDYEYVASFIGTEPKKANLNGIDVYEFTAYDKMATLDIPADDFISTLTFPCECSDITDALTTYFGNDYTFDLYYSWAIQIQSNPFPTGCTIRQILAWIAEVSGGYFVARGYDGYFHDVYFSRPDYNVDYILTPDEYFSISKSEIAIPSIDAVRAIKTSDETVIQYPDPYTGSSYDIVDNPILNGWGLWDVSNVLEYTKDNRLTYTDTPDGYIPMSVNAIGNWLVEVGDIIDVEDMNGNTIPLRIFSRVLHWDGALCTDYYECTGSYDRNKMSEEEKTSYKVISLFKSKVADNLITTTKGFALDASQGKILNNSISALSDKVDVIGTKKSNSSSGTINCSENTKSAGCSITITAGTWIVSANATIYKCVSGKRQGITVTSNSSAGQYNRYCYELRNSPASTTANQYYNVSHVWTVTGNTTLYVMLYNGNVSTSYEASIDAVRIL